MSDIEDASPAPPGPVYEHGERERAFELATTSEDSRTLEEHIARHVGEVETVFGEAISDLVRINIHWVPPGEGRAFHTLVTTGMSDLPMTPPEEAARCRYAELVTLLPPEWPIGEAAFEDEMHSWPIAWMRFLARFPHVYGTWLWWGHTVPNGAPPAPFHESTEFAGAILAEPVSLPVEMAICRRSPEKEVSFFAVVPLYPEELDLKVREGAEALFRRFDRSGISDVIEIGRANVAR